MCPRYILSFTMSQYTKVAQKYLSWIPSWIFCPIYLSWISCPIYLSWISCPRYLSWISCPRYCAWYILSSSGCLSPDWGVGFPCGSWEPHTAQSSPTPLNKNEKRKKQKNRKKKEADARNSRQANVGLFYRLLLDVIGELVSGVLAKSKKKDVPRHSPTSCMNSIQLR